MSNKTRGICCGGDYADNNSGEPYQTRPSKRHNAKKDTLTFLSVAERRKLAIYINVYCQYEQENHPDRFDKISTDDLITNAINAYMSINYNE